jgi:hypothetical protein
MNIIVSRDGKNHRKIEECWIKDEAYLQKYVSDYPNCLPLPFLLVVGREFRTSSGRIDVLAVDQEGELYIVETKLYKNPDKRRVVAQVLDYGASLWKNYGDPDTFLRDVDQAISQSGEGTLKQQLQKAYDIEEQEADQSIANIKRNLSDGNIKFVVLMDQMHTELRDLILFINAKSRFDIYAVEMEFYEHEGLEIVIPRMFGSEIKKEVEDTRDKDPRYIWTEQRFMEEAARTLNANEFSALQRLSEFSKKNATEEIAWKCLTFRSGGKANVVVAKFGRLPLFSFDTNGTLWLHFKKTAPNAVLRDRFKAVLTESKFLPAPTDEDGELSIKIADWADRLPIFEEALIEISGPESDSTIRRSLPPAI